MTDIDTIAALLDDWLDNDDEQARDVALDAILEGRPGTLTSAVQRMKSPRRFGAHWKAKAQFRLLDRGHYEISKDYSDDDFQFAWVAVDGNPNHFVNIWEGDE